MAYSASLREFVRSLGNVSALIREERRLPDPPPLEDQHLAAALRGAATMFMVATFEVYLVSAFTERVERLNELCAESSTWTYGDLPEKVRQHNTMQSLNLALRGPRYLLGASEPNDRAARFGEVERVISALAAKQLVITAFNQTESNPGPKTVRELFRPFAPGDDLFVAVKPEFEKRWKKPEAGEFISDTLENILTQRHRVVHRGIGLDIARSDLRKWAKFLNVLARSLDAHHKHLFDGQIKIAKSNYKLRTTRPAGG
jgi:hypothetical protein